MSSVLSYEQFLAFQETNEKQITLRIFLLQIHVQSQRKKFTAKLFVHHNIWRTKQKKKIGRYKLTFISLLKKQVNIYKSHTQNETQSDKIIHHNSMQISHHTIWLQVMQLRKSQ